MSAKLGWQRRQCTGAHFTASVHSVLTTSSQWLDGCSRRWCQLTSIQLHGSHVNATITKKSCCSKGSDIPHRRSGTNHSTVFIWWRQCAPPSNTWFLEPGESAAAAERHHNRSIHFAWLTVCATDRHIHTHRPRYVTTSVEIACIPCGVC